jgi:ABC-2 type transport system ATP-binding protein
MNQRETAISVKGLEKSFKQVKVLKGIDFSVAAGSVFALLGSNGAGKTTTIKILTTLTNPDKGSATVAGFDVVRQPGRVRESISLAGQDVAVDTILTGRENMRLIGKLRHLSSVETEADTLLKRFDLADAADRRVATYSGGMARRLDLIMSLLGSPSIMFLDEPTTGLDPQSRLAAWQLIKDLAGSGITVFLTTQHLEEADQLADKIAILNDGIIAVEGTPAELKKLLPHGHIELKFLDEGDMRSAKKLLNEYDAAEDENNLALAIITDGSIKQMTDVLKRLESAEIPVAGFAQKLPTLEDVFLSYVGKDKSKAAAV